MLDVSIVLRGLCFGPPVLRQPLNVVEGLLFDFAYLLLTNQSRLEESLKVVGESLRGQKRALIV